jgi:hypothetical protein
MKNSHYSLKRKEITEATLEILTSRELMAQIKDAEKSIKKNKMEDFTYL